MISVRQEGGEKLAAYLRDVRKFQSEKLPDIEVGVLPGSRFSKGGAVAPVAHKFEKGDSRQPARPFLRQSLPAIRAAVRRIIGNNGMIDDATLGEIGAEGARIVKASLIEFNGAALSPRTVAAKRRKGFAHPSSPGRASLELEDLIAWRLLRAHVR